MKDKGELIRFARHADGTSEHGRRGMSRAYEPLSEINLNKPENMTTIRRDRFSKTSAFSPNSPKTEMESES